MGGAGGRRPSGASGSLIHTRLEGGRVWHLASSSVNHTQVIIANLCGPAPYPALIRIDVMEEAVAVGWLS